MARVERKAGQAWTGSASGSSAGHVVASRSCGRHADAAVTGRHQHQCQWLTCSSTPPEEARRMLGLMPVAAMAKRASGVCSPSSTSREPTRMAPKTPAG